jgi:hypothetical protein
MTRRILALGCVVAVAAAVPVLIAPAGAAKLPSVPKPPKPPTGYNARVVVTGGITVTSYHDDTAECVPGRRWTQVNSLDLDLRKTLKIVIGNDLFAGLPSGGARSGSYKGEIRDYAETNNCPPAQKKELEKPECSAFELAPVTMTLTTDPRPGPERARLAIGRTRGSGESGLCIPPALNATPKTALLSVLDRVGTSLLLPLDLRVSSLKTLGRGKKLIRRLHVGGDCDKAIVYRGNKIRSRATTRVNRHGECSVDGSINVEITRR